MVRKPYSAGGLRVFSTRAGVSKSASKLLVLVVVE